METPKTDKKSPEQKGQRSLSPIVKSIIRYLCILLVIQYAIFLAFSLPVGFFSTYWAGYTVTVICFHLFIGAALIWLRNDFRIEESGVVLDHINKANRITLLRLSTLPTLLFLIFAAKHYSIRYPLIALVVLVFLTDFADGYISRKEGEVTRVGRILDSTSDYCLLIVLSIVFYYFELIPKWFFALAIARFSLQALLMGSLILINGKVQPKTTMMGKVAVASIMMLYALEVIKIALPLPAFALLVIRICEYICGGIVAASMVDKVLAFIREVRAGRAQRASKDQAVRP